MSNYEIILRQITNGVIAMENDMNQDITYDRAIVDNITVLGEKRIINKLIKSYDRDLKIDIKLGISEPEDIRFQVKALEILRTRLSRLNNL